MSIEIKNCGQCPYLHWHNELGDFCDETGKPIGYPDKKIHKDCPHKGKTLTIKFNDD